jgi:hypothetical protein
MGTMGERVVCWLSATVVVVLVKMILYRFALTKVDSTAEVPIATSSPFSLEAPS